MAWRKFPFWVDLLFVVKIRRLTDENGGCNL